MPTTKIGDHSVSDASGTGLRLGPPFAGVVSHGNPMTHDSGPTGNSRRSLPRRSFAYDITGAGQVVGPSEAADGNGHAFFATSC